WPSRKIQPFVPSRVPRFRARRRVFGCSAIGTACLYPSLTARYLPRHPSRPMGGSKTLTSCWKTWSARTSVARETDENATDADPRSGGGRVEHRHSAVFEDTFEPSQCGVIR